MKSLQAKLLNCKYKSREEAVNDHKNNYRSQGGLKDKFRPDGPDKYRIARICDNVPEGSMVLDIGCNDGSLGYLLQKKSCTVFGVDAVSELVEVAKRKGVFAKVAEAEELPFPENRFDVAVCAETLEHLFDPEYGVKEAHRVLKPGGIFLGSVPHPNGYMGISRHADYHQFWFDVDILMELLGGYFQNVVFEGIPYSQEFCNKNNLSKDMKQWIFFHCKKEQVAP